jgi:hypothetical protein
LRNEAFLLDHSFLDLKMTEPTLESIKIELEEEKKKNEKLTKKLEKITEAHSNLQKFYLFFLNLRVVEEEEDFIANKLTKKLNELQVEKKRIALEVEQEEEALTNNLQKKLEVK